MKYLIALIVCIAEFLTYSLIAANVFDWKAGGGIIVMIIFLFVPMGLTWRHITKKETLSKSQVFKYLGFAISIFCLALFIASIFV